MSNQITTAFVKQFGAEVELLVQQRGSRLRRAVDTESGIRAESAFFEQIGAIPDADVAVNLPRHSDSPLMETPHSRRRVTMKNFEWGDLIDDFDRVQTLIDPTNPYTMNAGFAIGRQVDLEIIDKFFAAAFTGKEGTVSVPFSTTATTSGGNRVVADFDGDSTDEGMTVQKLREARRVLLKNEAWMDGERAYVCMSSKQMDDLLATTEFTSADFNTVRALVNGEVDTFLGFTFIRTELLPYSDAPTNTIRRCPVWVQSGMKLGIGMEPTSRITPDRADKRYSTYVYWRGRFGATRMQEPKVLEILAKE